MNYKKRNERPGYLTGTAVLVCHQKSIFGEVVGLLLVHGGGESGVVDAHMGNIVEFGDELVNPTL